MRDIIFLESFQNWPIRLDFASKNRYYSYTEKESEILTLNTLFYD